MSGRRPLLRRRLPLLLLAAGSVSWSAPAPAFDAPGGPAPPTLIRGARVVDGTGAPARTADVRLRDGRIAAVGPLDVEPGERVVDAAGLVLAPGFIDTHSHHDRGLFDAPDALAAVSQGITTIIVGQDGGSVHPVSDLLDRLDREPAAVNVATYSGHGTLRQRVLGDDFRRAATAPEVAAMARLLERDLDAGALGLSTGLEYDPGIYAETDEVVALARVAAVRGGRYFSHIRSEDRRVWEAVDELLAIGDAAGLPVHLSHAKLAIRRYWGEAPRLLARLDSARARGVDVTLDVYPYTYWQSTLTVLFPDRNFEDRVEAAFVLAELASADDLLLGDYEPRPEYAGRTVAEIAALRGEDAVTTLIALIRDAEAARSAGGRRVESVIGTSMAEEDIEAFVRWPYANFSTDGQLEGAHPRGFGAFPRVLGRYVRERGVLSLEEAVHKLTQRAASNAGLAGRGEIRPGWAADLVLFDSAAVLDRATPRTPHAVSDGIAVVWVNGVPVYENGAPTGARPGLALRRGGSGAP